MSPFGDFTLRYLVPDWDPHPCFERRVRDDARCCAAKRLGDFADEIRGCLGQLEREKFELSLLTTRLSNLINLSHARYQPGCRGN